MQKPKNTGKEKASTSLCLSLLEAWRHIMLWGNSEAEEQKQLFSSLGKICQQASVPTFSPKNRQGDRHLHGSGGLSQLYAMSHSLYVFAHHHPLLLIYEKCRKLFNVYSVGRRHGRKTPGKRKKNSHVSCLCLPSLSQKETCSPACLLSSLSEGTIKSKRKRKRQENGWDHEKLACLKKGKEYMCSIFLAGTWKKAL